MRPKRIKGFETYYLYVVKPHLYPFKPELYRTFIFEETQKFLGKNRLEMHSVVFDRIQIHCRYRLTPEEQNELGRRLSFEKLSIRTEPHVWQFTDKFYRGLSDDKKFVEAVQEVISKTVAGLLLNSVRVKSGRVFFLTLKDLGKPCFDKMLNELPKILSQFSPQKIRCYLIDRLDPLNTRYPFLDGGYLKSVLEESDPESDYIVSEINE